MEKIKIKDDYITLGQLLKLLDIVASGGMIRLFLQDNAVLVNGEKEERRGRKLYAGDKVKIQQKEYEIC